MRLIDADALADALFDKRKNYPQWVADTIGNMPDAVVRCKDCIWFHKSDSEKNLCECIYHGFVTNEDKYCWWGEKKDA